MKKSTITILMLCIFLFSYCGKKSPTTPDIPSIILPIIEYFDADADSIEFMSDSIVTLSWSTKNATSVMIDQGIGNVDKTGNVEVSPEETTTYTLTAINSDGQKTASCKVEVDARAIFELTSYEHSYTPDYLCCRIIGTVQNVGNATGYNVMIEFQAYVSDVIVDTALGFPADLGSIPVGASALFDAVFYDFCGELVWDAISKVTYEITWLTAQGMSMTQIGVVRNR